MEEKRYEEKGRVFESVKIPLTYFKNGPLGIKPPEEGDNSGGPKGIIYNNDKITLVTPFINAVDIDWNKANVGNGQIETTSDLLNWIEKDALDLRSVMFKLAKGGPIILCDEAYIRDLRSKNINTDYLTVNKAAHFFELVVDQMRSVLGTQINTAANCVVDFVEAYDSNNIKLDLNLNNVPSIAYFRVYWRNSNSEGKSIENKWKTNDQAYCQTFNITGNASNTYYWRLVTASSSDENNPVFINFDKEVVADSAPITFNIKFSFTNNLSITALNNEWNNEILTWTPLDTSSKLEITPNEEEIFENNLFNFDTDIQTKLNVLIHYKDGTLNYIPATEYTEAYRISVENNIESIIITTAVIDKWEQCNWIDLSNITLDSASTTFPAIGDNIAQLGYRYNLLQNPTQDDISRASAIIIAAYKTPDAGIIPPSYALYLNIIDFDLSSHRKTYFDALKAKFVGDFEVVANPNEESKSIVEYINSLKYDNPLLISTDIDSIFLVTDSLDKIYSLDNFPETLNISFYYQDELGQKELVTPTTLTLTLFGQSYTIGSYGNSSSTKIYVNDISVNGNIYSIGFAFPLNLLQGLQILKGDLIAIQGTYGDFTAYKTVPITALNVTKGTDSELWKLFKVKEYAVVGEDSILDVYLEYKIQHIIGTTYTYDDTSNFIIQVLKYDALGQQIGTDTLDNDNENESYIFRYHNSNWYSEEHSCNFIIVQLKNTSDDVLDTSLISVILKPTSLFKVKEGLTESIHSLGENYTRLTLTVNTINTKVGFHTNDLTALRSNISEIALTANGISLSASNIVKIQNGEFPEDTNYEKYIFYKENLAPNTPEGEITYDTSDAGVWTTYRLEPSSVYQYVWISKKTLSLELDFDGSDSEEPEWSEWSTPILFQKYGQDRGYASKADLTIAADGIKSEVSRNYVAKNGFETEVKSIINLEADSIKTLVENALNGNISTIELTANGISLSINNIINELSKIGINISGNDSKIKLIANSTDFFTPTGQKMISVEMCTEEGKIDQEHGNIPSIVFYNNYGTPIWILNYLVGMKKVYITNTYSWDLYNLIKIGNNAGGMEKNLVIYPEAFFPLNATIEKPSISEAQPRGNRISEKSAYKFNAAYGEAIEGGEKSYIPTTAGLFDGSFWINTLVNNESISDGWTPDNTNNTSLNGYYILRKADDNSSFNVIDDLNFSGVNAFNPIDMNGDTPISNLDSLVNTAANLDYLSQNYSIKSEQEIDYLPGGYTISNNYTIGTQPAVDGDIFAEFEHYDEYILLEFKNGCVINRFEFIIYYKTLVNRKNNIIKYVLLELEDGQPVYVSKVIIRKGTDSIESEWITIKGIIDLLSE